VAFLLVLVDLGFIYFCGLNPPPEDADKYPLLDLEDIPLRKDLQDIKYAVMTPGCTAKTRAMPASVYNAICDHLLNLNIIPVHLGVTEMDGGIRKIEMNEGYDFSKGIDLRNKTSVIEAAKTMDCAEMVIGIDNGLLHLASMTKTTVIFGYTMVGPRHRRPNRWMGRIYELHADKEKLPCLFCQEKMRFFFDHHFTNCIYKENEPQCVKAINKESFIATIDLAIKEMRGQ
jgi:ADP-heptose:LPS heptosyltransferase